jgi:hypothetical protein
MSDKNEEGDAVSLYEEEEEVEVTDDDVDVIDEDKSESGSVQALKTPSKVPGKAPGKVTPSKAVKDMKMATPENVSKGKTKYQTLPANKNPFTTFGAWSEDTLSQIEILMPALTGKNESTNELTRSTRPEARYWKAPIVFKYGNFTSTTMRFDNVPIPFHTGKGYGSNFIYLCLPGFVADKFSEAGKSRRPTVVNEKSLQPDRNRWWKVANKVDDSFGIINGRTNKFQRKSLEVIFDATSSGITASVVLSFMFKASTDSMEPLKPTTSGTIAVNLERGFISATDVNVEMPVRINNRKTKADPTAVSRDVADDSLIKRLAELGL